MCGIAGFTGNNKEKQTAFQEMLSHRDHDDKGLYSDEQVSISQTCLSILDLSDAGHQPMFYIPNKGACSQKHHPELMQQSQTGIVYNGKIFNRKEVKSLLHSKGYIFSTESDAELIMAAYLEWGTKCLERINGMWAFCIYDKKNQVLFISRDRMGIKPLYYHYTNGVLTFASEMKPFYKSGIPKEINKKALNHYYILNTSPGEDTILKDVKKLRPASNLIYDLKSKRIGLIEQYWKKEFSEQIIDQKDAQVKLEKLLRDSVKKRMLSNAEVGAFLSGGVNSSLIVMLMREFTDQLKTFSIKFDQEDYNETHYAKIISDKFNTKHYEVEFNAEDVKKLIDTLPLHYDEPFGDSSVIPTYLVSQVASEHVKAVLSGTGSNEIFGGNERYKEYYKLLKTRTIPKFIRNTIILRSKKLGQDKVNKLKQLLATKDNYLLYVKLLSDVFRTGEESHYNLDDIEDILQQFNGLSNLNALLSFDQNHYLFNNLLINEDRATTANSIESRLPFLDYRLTEFAGNLNTDLKMRNNTRRYIIKETFKNQLPKEIINRKQMSFGVPLKHYFRKELKTHVEAMIFDNISFAPGLNENYLRQMWELHQSGSSDYSSFFWNVLMLIKWHENYML